VIAHCENKVAIASYQPTNWQPAVSLPGLLIALLKMRLLQTLVLTLLSPPTILASSSSIPADNNNPSQITLGFIPLIASTNKLTKPKPFATLDYTSTNNSYTLSSYTAPQTDSSIPSNSLARIGVLPISTTTGTQKKGEHAPGTHDGFGGSSSTAALLSLLTKPESAVIRIALDSRGGVFSVGFNQVQDGGEEVKGMPRLEVVQSAVEVRPLLNRPIVLDRDGKVPKAEEGEKTFLQR
jgi:hypothetical protein